MEWTGRRGHAINRIRTLYPCGSHDEISCGMDRNGRTAGRCEGWWRGELLPFWELRECAVESAICSRDRGRSSARKRPAFRHSATCTEACLSCDLVRRHDGSREGQEAHAHADQIGRDSLWRSAARRFAQGRRLGLGKAEAITNSARPACARHAAVCLADPKSPLVRPCIA